MDLRSSEKNEPLLAGHIETVDGVNIEVVTSSGSIQSEPGYHGHTTLSGAVFNFVCTCVGAGIVSLPQALADGGWFALILIAMVAVFSNYTAKLLVECLHLVPGRRLRTYEEIGFECFGVKGYRLVAVVQNVTLFGVCTIFLILIGSNMNTLISQLSLHDWIFVFALFLLPVAYLKTMSEIAVLATFGVTASACVGFVIIYRGLVSYEAGASEYTAFNASGIAPGFNIIIFSFGFHSVLPALEHEMADPTQFPQVANIACLIIGIFYLFVSTCGYLGWGSDVQGNVLQSMNSDNWMVQLAYAMITTHVTLAYPLPLNPISLALEDFMGISKLSGPQELLARLPLRTALVLATVLIASIFPYFGDFLSFVSSISTVFVAFVFPPIFNYVLKKRRGIIIPRAHLILMVVICLIGCVGSVAGLYYSTTALIDDFEGGGNPFSGYF